MPASPRFPSPIAVLVTTLVTGCVIPMPVGNGDDEGGDATSHHTGDDASIGASSAPLTAGDATGASTTTPSTDTAADGTATADATGPVTDDGTGTDTSAESPCAGVTEFECSAPIDCTALPCGDMLFPFDAAGCMRPPCAGPRDCADDQLCLFPYETHGVCTGSGMSCSDGRDGACECVSNPDCGGGFCVTDCAARRDAASCEADDCAVATVIDISETCACTEDAFVCFDAGVGIGLPTGYLWHEETLRVAYFHRPFTLPIGWRLCTDAGAPPACGCFDPTSPPECP